MKSSEAPVCDMSSLDDSFLNAANSSAGSARRNRFNQQNIPNPKRFDSQPSNRRRSRRRPHQSRRKKSLQISDVDFSVQKHPKHKLTHDDLKKREEAKDLWFEQKLAIFRKRQTSKASPDASQPNGTLPQFKLPHKYNIVIAFKEKAVTRWIESHIFNDGDGIHPSRISVGMDFEWDCITSKRQDSFPDLIQIATEKSCLLYQVRRNRPAESFVRLLRNHSVKKFMVDPSSDLRKLANWFHAFGVDIHLMEAKKAGASEDSASEKTLDEDPQQYSITTCSGKQLKDVRILRRCFPSIINLDSDKEGAASLCRKHLSEDLNKAPEVVLSRWSRHCLQKEQVEYAACDAYLNVRLACELKVTRTGCNDAYRSC